MGMANTEERVAPEKGFVFLRNIDAIAVLFKNYEISIKCSS